MHIYQSLSIVEIIFQKIETKYVSMSLNMFETDSSTMYAGYICYFSCIWLFEHRSKVAESAYISSIC